MGGLAVGQFALQSGHLSFAESLAALKLGPNYEAHGLGRLIIGGVVESHMIGLSLIWRGLLPSIVSSYLHSTNVPMIARRFENSAPYSRLGFQCPQQSAESCSTSSCSRRAEHEIIRSEPFSTPLSVQPDIN